MGLDMYLTAAKYFGNYEHLPEKDKDMFQKILEVSEISPLCVSEDSPSLYVEVTVAYWRKANQIHNWFVQNVQEGVDKCHKAYVSTRDLENLLLACRDALDHKGKDEKKAAQTLPTVDGFFFGSSEIDEWYWQDIEYTIQIIEKILTNPEYKNLSFYYHSSW